MKRLLLVLVGLVLAAPAQAQVLSGPVSGVPLTQSLPGTGHYTDSSFFTDGGSLPGSGQGNCTVWGTAEYLLWWIKNGPTPPLVTTGNPNIAATGGIPGALDQPGTAVLFGGSPLNYGTFSGMRYTVGAWLDPDCNLGVEASGFVLERRTVGFGAASDSTGNPPLYVPFFNVATGREGSLTIADPVFGFNGNIAVLSSTQLWGTEGNALIRLGGNNMFNAGLLLGFRYLDLSESLGVVGNYNDYIFNVQNTYSEGFNTRNQFYGGQVGGRIGFMPGPLGFELTGKVGLGTTHEVLNTTGLINVSGPGAFTPGTFPGGGVFVQPSNLGRQVHNNFSVVPQVNGKVGYNVFNWLRLTVGYDFLYWSNVIRPGDQIDRSLNPTQVAGGTLAGPPNPFPLYHHTDFIAHGVSFGMQFSY